ncbi:fibronectin type II domain-containing protein [Blautia luti]
MGCLSCCGEFVFPFSYMQKLFLMCTEQGEKTKRFLCNFTLEKQKLVSYN